MGGLITRQQQQSEEGSLFDMGSFLLGLIVMYMTSNFTMTSTFLYSCIGAYVYMYGKDGSDKILGLLDSLINVLGNKSVDYFLQLVKYAEEKELLKVFKQLMTLITNEMAKYLKGQKRSQPPVEKSR